MTLVSWVVILIRNTLRTIANQRYRYECIYRYFGERISNSRFGGDDISRSSKAIAASDEIVLYRQAFVPNSG